jgi:hypothetical protein
VEREPTAVGLNFTKIVQEELAGSVLESRDLPMVPAFARPADAKEAAIVCLSAALLFASLAVLALATEQ